MKKKNIRRQIIVRDISYEDKSDIIKLITKVYGREYYKKEFYTNDLVERYINDSIIKNHRKVYWNVAVYQDQIIGQMLFVLRHSAGFLILTMVDPDYADQGVITIISLRMIQFIPELNQEYMGCIYAIIEADNIAMEKVLIKFDFVKLGEIPSFGNNEGSLIYGRIVYDFRWKMVNPHAKLAFDVYTTVRSAKLKRLVSAMGIPSLDVKGLEREGFKIETRERPYKRWAVASDGTVCATFQEEINQQSWYDIKVSDGLALHTKERLIKYLLEQFYTHKEIKGASFAVDAEDRESQWILGNVGATYCAYLPFYFEHKDHLLLHLKKED